MNIYKNNEPCKTCPKKCCENMGCELHPDDVKEGVSYRSIKSLLDSGLYSIDWWHINDEDKGFFIRARNVNGGIVDSSYGGRCILLGEDGCKLSFEDRPRGGQRLIASDKNPPHSCKSDYSKYEAYKAWSHHDDLLHELYHEYREEDIYDASKDGYHINSLIEYTLQSLIESGKIKLDENGVISLNEEDTNGNKN